MPMTQSREDYPGNVRLAQAIRRVEEIHEASWDKEPSYDKSLYYVTGRTKGYAKPYHDCIREVVGDDPIAKILACLFTAGYADMYDFCDTVLGPAAPTQEGGNE